MIEVAIASAVNKKKIKDQEKSKGFRKKESHSIRSRSLKKMPSK